MAINIQSDQGDSLQITINNGDLKALNDIIASWKFKDKESALRFALAILAMTSSGSLYQGKPDGTKVALQPQEALINKG